jgi:formylmethanofuran dehydrogenase subunit E
MDLHELLSLSSSQHSHLCPRQVLGVRMGLAGMVRIGIPAPMPHKEAVIFIETDGCFATGIEVATGAAVGHRTLRHVDLGKIAATFANVETGQAFRLAPRLDIRQRALEYASGLKNKYYAQLKGYQLMPDEELFSFETVSLQPTIKEIVSRPGVRVKCSQCGEEIINDRQMLVREHLLCRTCAGSSYYGSK